MSSSSLHIPESSSSSSTSSSSSSSSSSTCHSVKYTRSALSTILSTHRASQILGEDTVRCIVRSFLRCIAAVAARNPAFSSHLLQQDEAKRRDSFNSNRGADSYNRDICFRRISENVVESSESEEEQYWIDTFTAALCYDFDSNGDDDDSGYGTKNKDSKSKGRSNGNGSVPEWCIAAWHRLRNIPSPSSYAATLGNNSVSNLTTTQKQQMQSKIPFPILGLDKPTALRLGSLFPPPATPFVGNGGHMALTECIFYAIASPPPMYMLNHRFTPLHSSNSTASTATASTAASTRSTGNSIQRSNINLSSNRGPLMPSANTSISSSASFAAPEQGHPSLAKTRTLILLPDLIIFWAITRQYLSSFPPSPDMTNTTAPSTSHIATTTSNQKEEAPQTKSGPVPNSASSTSSSSSTPPNLIGLTVMQKQALTDLTTLSFRMYDGYQKRSVLTRDTLHRFLWDIHGEEYLSRPAVKKVLDAIFVLKSGEGPALTSTETSSPNDSKDMVRKNSTGSVHSSGESNAKNNAQTPTRAILPPAPTRNLAHLNEVQYVYALEQTVGWSQSRGRPSHILLDWFVCLANATLPSFIAGGGGADDVDAIISPASFWEINNTGNPRKSTRPGMQRLLQAKIEMMSSINHDAEIRMLCRKYGILEDRNELGNAGSVDASLSNGYNGVNANRGANPTDAAVATGPAGGSKINNNAPSLADISNNNNAVRYMQLYEVKRRFRSVVDLSSNASSSGSNIDKINVKDEDFRDVVAEDEDDVELKQGDEEEDNESSSLDGSSVAEEGHHLPIDESEGQPSSGAAVSVSPEKDTTTTGSRQAITAEEKGYSKNEQPRNVIHEHRFLQIASQSNEELGHGGFLSEALAKLTFQAGCDSLRRNTNIGCREKLLNLVGGTGAASEENSERYMEEKNIQRDTSNNKYWTFYDVLSFGCSAVRGESLSSNGQKLKGYEAELDFLKFVYSAFLLLPRDGNINGEGDIDVVPHTDTILTVTTPLENGNGELKLSKDGKKTEAQPQLSRFQVGRMLLLLLDHAAFRLEADSPVTNDASRDARRSGKEREIDLLNLDETMVEVSPASLLGLLPHNISIPEVDQTDISAEAKVSLNVLIDFVFSDSQIASQKNDQQSSNDSIADDTSSSKIKQSLSFEDFLNWYYNPRQDHVASLQLSQRRIGPFLLDLRLLASILFGIKPTSPITERHLIREVVRRHKYRYPESESAKRGPMGTVWYVIQANWWNRWVTYAENHLDKKNVKSLSLQRIENNHLLVDDGSLALRAGLRWKNDFELVAPLAWSALQAWHDGGPPIHRSVVAYAAPNKSSSNKQTQCEIELYPTFVTVLLSDSTSRGETRPFQQYFPVSSFLPLEVLLKELCQSLDIETRNGRLWMMGSKSGVSYVTGDSHYLDGNANGSDWLLRMDVSLVDQLKEKGITKFGDEFPGKTIVLLLELKDDKEGTWPRGQKHNREIIGNQQKSSKAGNMIGDGIVGLYNMGNTCYLNSSIQCLSHTPIFRDYFTSKSYLNDINTANPLGHQGRLAQVSAVLINSLWKLYNQPSLVNAGKKVITPGQYVQLNSAHALTPKTFKDAMGKFNDHFAGNEQHDAQELLAFLLSGLSEDLNRIVNKPYIEAPDSDGRPDKELADIWWSNHLKREWSIIVALFTGQYKSLLTCRTCKYESARFEPFTFLQLPLPEDDQVTVQFILFPLRDRSNPTKYSIRSRHDGTLFDALVNLAKVLYADEIEREIELTNPARETSSSETRDTNFSSCVLSNGEDKAPVPDSDGDKVSKDDKVVSKGCEDNTSHESVEPLNEIRTGDDEEDKEEERREKICVRMAHNMAVVRMGDGYIFNIVPDSWFLSKLNSRETGELPLLYVYELDPLPHKIENEQPLDSSRATGSAKIKMEKEGIKEATAKSSKETNVERSQDAKNIEDVSTSLHSSIKSDTITQNASKRNNSDITEDGTKVGRAAKDIPGERQEKFDATNPIPPDASKQSADVKYSYLAIVQRKLELLNRPFLHPWSQRVFGTPMLLRVVDLEGYTGCDLYDLVAKRIKNFVPCEAFSFLSKKRYDGAGDHREQDAKKSSSSNLRNPGKLRGGRQQRIKTTLDMEEAGAGRIPRYGFRLRIASRDGRKCALCPWFECCIGCLVPDDDYPTIVMCGDSIALDWHLAVDVVTNGFGVPMGEKEVQGNGQARFLSTVKKHRTCHVGNNKYGYRGCITLEECLETFSKEERIPEAYCSKCKEFRVQTKQMSLWRLPPVMIIHLKRFQFTQHTRRKLRDLVVFPTEGLDMARIIASGEGKKVDKKPANGSPKVENSGAEIDDDDDSIVSTAESLYDLYGVVHHQGALSGGHYVASLKSESDGKWRLFNDAQIYEICSRDVVDASAYILFYVRRDVKDASLEDFWDTKNREGEGMTEEEVEKMMKHRERCVIS